MEGEIILHPLKSNQNHANSRNSGSHGSLITPDRNIPARNEQRDSIPDGIGGNKSSCRPVGNGKTVFNEGKDRGEGGTGKKVEEPEAPEDE
jgi:hypothetical protein